MALNSINLEPKVKTSGGKGGMFGKIAGAVVGGAAGALAGQPLAGAAAGSALGGALGTLADPVKQKVVGDKGIALTSMQNEPGVKLAGLVDAQNTMLQSPDFTEPQKQELLNTVFNPTITALKQRIG